MLSDMYALRKLAHATVMSPSVTVPFPSLPSFATPSLSLPTFKS